MTHLTADINSPLRLTTIMKHLLVAILLCIFSFSQSIYAQDTKSQGIVANWGQYVRTTLTGYGAALLQVQVDGQNHRWHGIFSINGGNSYTPELSWNNVRLISYSNYNTSKDDVKVLIMSNSATNAFGGTEIVIKLEQPVSGSADVAVRVLGGHTPTALSLVSSSSAPFTYTMASSAGTLNSWTVNNKVGIGTITPKTRLDLQFLRMGGQSEFPAEGSISEEDWPNFIIGDDGLQRLRLGVTNDSYTRAEIDFDNSNRQDGTIAFKTAPASGGALTRLFVHGNGNVGIGTGTTDIAEFKLAVNGTIGAKKVKVTLANWPDYVFAPDYSLMPLSSLRQYIQANSHLPGIPSAREVEDKGLDLGDNQAALLKKIEELTLYILDQDKIITAQQLDLEKLKEENKKTETMRNEWEKLKKELLKKKTK